MVERDDKAIAEPWERISQAVIEGRLQGRLEASDALQSLIQEEGEGLQAPLAKLWLADNPRQRG